SITIDKKYILGGTGYLQNPQQIGYGYEDAKTKVKRPDGEKLTWKFYAPNVHDFVWAADPGYKHLSKVIRDSLTIHVLYKPTNEPARDWEALLNLAEVILPYLERTFGTYPYKQYSFIHGGDGGMEYPMATLSIGPGAVIHEWLHSWYYGLMANNELLYPWMDEGFTQYAEDRLVAQLNKSTGFPYAESYGAYYSLVKSGKEEPLTTHADHYITNNSYTLSAYYKGEIFLEQLGYIVGATVRDKILLEYYRLWKYKHPTPIDFINVAEKVSDMKLDWYREYWINSTKTIDYGIDSLWEEGGKTKVRIKKIGLIPMPIDLQLTFRDGTKELHYIPMGLMYGEKQVEDTLNSRKVYEPWKWSHSTYIIETSRRLVDFSLVEIDPSMRMADIERKDNKMKLRW
ncbi:MAG: M1 family aminopeptidase, partial [Chitinophagaceae bacterium]